MDKKFLKMQVHMTGEYAAHIKYLADKADCTPGKVANRLLANHIDLLLKNHQKENK